MKKRMLALLLAVVLVFCCAGCRERITADIKADKTEYLDSPDVAPTNTATIPTRSESSDSDGQQEAEPSETIPPQIEKSQEPNSGNHSNTKSESPSSEPKEPTTGSGGTETDPGTPGDDSGNSGSNGDSGGTSPGTPEKEKQKVTVKLSGAGGRVSPRSVERVVGKPYGELPTPTRGGYAFVGWFTATSGGAEISADTIVTQEATHTLYAHWTNKASHTVSFNPTKGWLGAKESSREVYQGQQYGLPFPTPTSYRGYEFVGWFTEETGGTQVHNTDIFTGNSDITLYAQWSYDPLAYWSGRLENCKAYPCQIQRVYVEFDDDNVTTSYCNIVSMTNSVNVAKSLPSQYVSDEEILDLRPDVVIKCISDMSNAAAVYNNTVARLGKHTFVFPLSAVYGSAESAVYYALYLGTLLYPEAFSSVDLSQAGAELGVSGYVYP